MPHYVNWKSLTLKFSLQLRRARGAIWFCNFYWDHLFQQNINISLELRHLLRRNFLLTVYQLNLRMSNQSISIQRAIVCQLAEQSFYWMTTLRQSGEWAALSAYVRTEMIECYIILLHSSAGAHVIEIESLIFVKYQGTICGATLPHSLPWAQTASHEFYFY